VFDEWLSGFLEVGARFSEENIPSSCGVQAGETKGRGKHKISFYEVHA